MDSNISNIWAYKIQIFKSPATHRYSHRVNINKLRLLSILSLFFSDVNIVETSINSNLCRRISFANAIKLIKYRFYGKLRRRTMANDLQLSFWASRVLGEEFFVWIRCDHLICLSPYLSCGAIVLISIIRWSNQNTYIFNFQSILCEWMKWTRIRYSTQASAHPNI